MILLHSDSSALVFHRVNICFYLPVRLDCFYLCQGAYRLASPTDDVGGGSRTSPAPAAAAYTTTECRRQRALFHSRPLLACLPIHILCTTRNLHLQICVRHKSVDSCRNDRLLNFDQPNLVVASDAVLAVQKRLEVHTSPVVRFSCHNRLEKFRLELRRYVDDISNLISQCSLCTRFPAWYSTTSSSMSWWFSWCSNCSSICSPTAAGSSLCARLAGTTNRLSARRITYHAQPAANQSASNWGTDR